MGETNKEVQLSISRSPAHDRCLIALKGEMKHENVDSIFKTIKGLYDEGCKTVVLDLSGVTYCDTSGLQSLVMIYKHVQSKSDLGFRVYPGIGQVKETLQTCRFDKFINILEDTKELEGFEDTSGK
jgi:anti-anti-sigma factor